MPQTFITKNQRRGHEFARAIENYIFESGETKLNLMKRAGMTSTKFYRRMSDPGTLTLEEFWTLCDIMELPPEVRSKIVG